LVIVVVVIINIVDNNLIQHYPQHIKIITIMNIYIKLYLLTNNELFILFYSYIFLLL